MIAVVDVGISNVGSVANMLRRLGETVVVTAVPEEIERADRVVLPGVGSFDVAMERLATLSLIEPLTRSVETGTVPVLGICLGMQLFADSSEEGVLPGLGWVGGAVRRLAPVDDGRALPVPHMGWNTVEAQGGDPLIGGIAESGRFYFVHSYAFVPSQADTAAGTTDYGGRFVSCVRRGNLLGVQFHPEKSHRHGRALLAAWLDAA